MRLSGFLASIVLIVVAATAQEIDNDYLKCLVCRAVIKETKFEIDKIDPNRRIDVGNYRLDAEGNEIKKTVHMARSAIHLSDILDNICNKLADYVRATYKSNGKLTILNLMSSSGTMNPDISKVDIVQDGDLNKSLEHLCAEVIDESEEDIIDFFQKEEKDNANVVCTNICDGRMEAEGSETAGEAVKSDERTEL